MNFETLHKQFHNFHFLGVKKIDFLTINAWHGNKNNFAYLKILFFVFLKLDWFPDR